MEATEKTVDIDSAQCALAAFQTLDSLRKEGEHCDFVVKIGEDELPVHKVVLSARSDYFRAMFKHDTEETRSGHVDMRDVDHKSVEKCIDFIYTGKASVLEENIKDLLHVATMLQLKELCNGLAQLLNTDLRPITYFPTLSWAITYNCKELVSVCEKFALENFEAIALVDGFKEVEKEYFLSLIGPKNTKSSEWVKCEALINWTKHDLASRTDCFPELLKQVDLAKISVTRLKQFVESESTVYESIPAMKQFTLSTLDSHEVSSEALVVFDKLSNGVLALTPTKTEGQTDIRFSRAKLQDMQPEMIENPLTAVMIGLDIFVLVNNQSHISVFKLNSSERNPAWEEMAEIKVEWQKIKATTLDEWIYVSNDGQLLKYSTFTKTWEHIAGRPTVYYGNVFGHNQEILSRTDSMIVAVNGSVYMIGGKFKAVDGSGYRSIVKGKIQAMNTVQQLTHVTSTWSTAATMNCARYGAAVTSKRGLIYVLGGFNNENQPCNRIETYDPDINAWTFLKPMTNVHADFSACIVDDRIFVVSKEPESEDSDDEVMNFYKGDWKKTDAFAKLDIRDAPILSLKI